MGQSAQPATAGKYVHYERRRAEETILYQLVQEHVETFFAQVKTEIGSRLPDFVKDEFDAFLECGVLTHGFLRLQKRRGQKAGSGRELRIFKLRSALFGIRHSRPDSYFFLDKSKNQSSEIPSKATQQNGLLKRSAKTIRCLYSLNVLERFMEGE